MTNISETSPRETSNRLYALVCSGAFFAIATEALISLLLPLLALRNELSLIQLGVIVAVGSIGPILLALPSGAFCDHFGDRRMMLVSALGVFFTSLAYTLFDDFGLLCGVAVVGGLFRAMSWVSTQSYALRFISAERRQKFMGHFSFVAGMGMLVSPLAAGYLAERVSLTAGFQFMACWGGTLMLVAWRLPEIARPEKAAIRVGQVILDSYRNALPLLARPVIVVIMAFTLLRLAAAAINSSFYPVHLDQVGISILLIGQLFALIHVGTSLGTLMAAPLTRYLPGPWVLGFALVLSTITIAVVPLFTTVIPIAVCTFLHGLGQGISLPQILAAIGRHADHSERGLVLGMRSMFNRVGYLFVPIILGVVAESAGLQVAFLSTATGILLLVIVSTVALLRIDR